MISLLVRHRRLCVVIAVVGLTTVGYFKWAQHRAERQLAADVAWVTEARSRGLRLSSSTQPSLLGNRRTESGKLFATRWVRFEIEDDAQADKLLTMPPTPLSIRISLGWKVSKQNQDRVVKRFGEESMPRNSSPAVPDFGNLEGVFRAFSK